MGSGVQTLGFGAWGFGLKGCGLGFQGFYFRGFGDRFVFYGFGLRVLAPKSTRLVSGLESHFKVDKLKPVSSPVPTKPFASACFKSFRMFLKYFEYFHLNGPPKTFQSRPISGPGPDCAEFPRQRNQWESCELLGHLVHKKEPPPLGPP